MKLRKPKLPKLRFEHYESSYLTWIVLFSVADGLIIALFSLYTRDLQGQLANLTKTIPKTNYTLVSNGSIAIYEYGPAQFIPFTSTPSQTKLNITFSGGLTIAMLLNQSQYDTFLTCNCYNYDNYTSSTWSSPASTFYDTIVAIPAPNTWYVAFVEPANNPNRGYFTDTETLQLVST